MHVCGVYLVVLNSYREAQPILFLSPRILLFLPSPFWLSSDSIPTTLMPEILIKDGYDHVLQSRVL